MSQHGTHHNGGAPTPYALPERYATSFNAGDLDGLVALYEPDAILLTEDGIPVRYAALRRALADSIAPGLSIHIGDQHVLATGTVALLCTMWTIHGVDAHGTQVSESGQSNDVGRLGNDGLWRYAIDNPTGVGPTASQR